MTAFPDPSKPNTTPNHRAQTSPILSGGGPVAKKKGTSKDAPEESLEETDEEEDEESDDDKKVDERSCFLLSDAQLTSLKPCSERVMQGAKILNGAMLKQSSNSALVITNLPDIPQNESAFGYMQFIETLTAGIDRMLLVRGTSTEVISAFT